MGFQYAFVGKELHYVKQTSDTSHELDNGVADLDLFFVAFRVSDALVHIA
jgi:hypothetical protein